MALPSYSRIWAVLVYGLYNTVCLAGAVVGPLATGWIKDLTGSFAASLHAAAALSVVCAVTAMALSPGFRAAPGASLAARYRP